VTQTSTFTVEYSINGSEFEQIATTVKQLQPRETQEHPLDESPIEVQMTFITPDGKETKVLQAGDIQTVSPADEAAVTDRFPVTGATQQERAVQLEQYASLHPSTVVPAHIITLLGSTDAKTARASVAALRYIVDERGDECISAIHQLRRHLDIHDDPIARDSLYCLASIARVSPEDVVFAATSITPYLTHETQQCRESALVACEVIATEDVDIIAGHEETLVGLIRDGSRTERVQAGKILATIAADYPERVEPFLPQLISRLSGSGRFEERIAVVSVVGRVAQANPTPVVKYIEDIAACLDAHNEKLRANAAATLYDLAAEDSAAVAEYTDSIATVLDGKTSYAKLNATGALARIADTHPSRVAPHVDTVLACLTNENKAVRVNTCCVLKRLGNEANVSTDLLTETALNDTDDDVQLQAFQALDEIETDGQ